MAAVAPPDPDDSQEFRELLARLTAVWAEEPIDSDGLDLIAAYIRAAYGLGYCEALAAGPPRPPSAVS